MRLDIGGMTLALALCTAAPGASAQEVLKLAQAASPSESATAQRLIGVAAWNTLVGNSLTGKEDGENSGGVLRT